jgi:Protein of unknown function (DUF3800)
VGVRGHARAAASLQRAQPNLEIGLHSPPVNHHGECLVLVFIDESGCSGFKLTKGSNAVFVVGMVVFARREDALETETIVQGLHSALGHKPEFRFSKCRDRTRDGFFSAVASCPFRLRALVVRKDRIYSPILRNRDEAFYGFFAKLLMRHDRGLLRDAKVRIDGSGDRDFQRSLKTYLRKQLGEQKLQEVRLVDSKRDPLVQLADMCVGAVARAYRDTENGRRWLRMLKPRIQDIWEFE